MRIIEWLKPGDEETRSGYPAYMGFFVALIGAAIAGIGLLLEWWWLYFIGFAVTAVGVIGGGIFVLWGFVTFPREIHKNIEAFRERNQKTWKRPDWKP